MASPQPALAALVCGFARGGTTVVSEMLRRHPALDAGFEGGFLLCARPRDFVGFEPFYKQLSAGWGLSPEEVDAICNVEEWNELYERLRSAYVGANATTRIFDKTPRYLLHLDEVMAKVPGTPTVVVARDPRAMFWSWRKRRPDMEHWMNEFTTRYILFGRGWLRVKHSEAAANVHVVQHETLLQDPGSEGRRMFDFLGLQFRPEFLEFESRWPNVYGAGLTIQYALEYREHFDDATCREILERTEEISEWRWDPDQPSE